MTFQHLTCSGEAGYLLYRATSILFQILFEYEFIAKLDRKDFLPWTAKTVSKKFSKLDKFSNIDTNSLYFVRIQPRRNLLDFVPQVSVPKKQHQASMGDSWCSILFAPNDLFYFFLFLYIGSASAT